MAAPTWTTSAFLSVALVLGIAFPASAQLCTVTYASTSALPLEFGIAASQGFFKQYNVVLCNRTVTGVSDVLAAIQNKTADFAYEATDNALDWYFNQNATVQIFAGGMLGSEIGLAVSRANNVTGFIDVPGRVFLVDSTTSGLVSDLWKITELNGVDRATYGIASTPSAQARYNDLVAGKTPTNQTVFGAMLQAPYWNMAKLLNNNTIVLLPRIAEQVSPFQGLVYVYDRNRTVQIAPQLTNLTAALIKANLYIFNPANKVAVINSIVTNNQLTPAVATDYYQSYVDGIQGSNYALQLSLPGFANVLANRQNYDPKFRLENANLFVQPSTGTLYNDQIYKAAYALASRTP